MSSEVAKRAVELATSGPVGAVRLLASGHTSDAWLVETERCTYIARLPIPRSKRRITYRVESFVGTHLAVRGHRVARWTVVDVHGRPCAVGPRLDGVPVEYSDSWTPRFATSLASLLYELHQMPVHGFGPLADEASAATGISAHRRQGVIDRWCHASIWPFDGSSLATHPTRERFPDLFPQISALQAAIERAQQGPVGVVHADLHREHLLVNGDGSLAGVLDFGAAFVGAAAWDFASLIWYYGRPNVELVAEAYLNGATAMGRGLLLSVPIGLYKAAKNPSDITVEPRLRRCVELATAEAAQ